MPGHPSNSQRFRDHICSSRQQAIEVEICGRPLPLFVYSYSSLGFSDLPERYLATREVAPLQLLSLYDLHHTLHGSQILHAPVFKTAARFLDSGVYETEGFADLLSNQHQAIQPPWSQELYVESARRFAHSGDVVVSFDHRSLSIDDQIAQGLSLFERIEQQGLTRDLLLHPKGASPERVADAIARLAPDIDVVGLTEKDIGFPWFISASYIHQLRLTLDDALGRYVPIHIFGCFDPQTISYFFFSGADIFDGLAWMRYYFHNGHAFNSREFEYKAPPEELLKAGEAAKNLLRHNVEELELLRTDLRYAVLTRDVSQFEECLENLKIFESTTVSQRSTDQMLR
jgi:hypothetical protein